MAGITHKSCVALFPLWSLKKKIVFIFLGGRGTADVNQQKHTKIQSLNLISCNNNYYLINNKYKNSNNNSDY